jgi:hypothetical protein
VSHACRRFSLAARVPAPRGDGAVRVSSWPALGDEDTASWPCAVLGEVRVQQVAQRRALVGPLGLMAGVNFSLDR